MTNDEYFAWRKKVTKFLDDNNINQPPCGFDIGEGWTEVVLAALSAMKEAGWEGDLIQVKQKFCQLRLYYDWSSKPDEELRKKVDEIVRKAARDCDVLCEFCGKTREKKGPAFGMAACSACLEIRGVI